jgi:2-polyprenyl-3-methyl-5-hydroxy-6-metoxy-1,4-benzoquinol methylase
LSARQALPDEEQDETMEETTPRHDEWESYWRATSQLVAHADTDAGSIWDAEAELVAARDLTRFRSVVDETLPLLDLGCGSGIQTKYLAGHFSRVIGVDVSDAAVTLAAAQNAAPNVAYQRLDIFDAAGVRRLHDELGDVNIYMRTLLHLVQAERRPMFAASIATLLGRRGTLYLYELGGAAHAYFGGFIERNGMPVRLARVLATGIRPGSVDSQQVASMFSPERFEVLAEGETAAEPVPVRVLGSDSLPKVAPELWAPPAYFMVLKPRSS